MKNFFKPEDFKATEKIEGFDFNSNQGQRNAIFSADRAQSILNALIESWPVVYGKQGLYAHDFSENQPEGTCTHKARLAFIEEIVKEPCKHEPEFTFNLGDGLMGFSGKCKLCGVELQATWSEKK